MSEGGRHIVFVLSKIKSIFPFSEGATHFEKMKKKANGPKTQGPNCIAILKPKTQRGNPVPTSRLSPHYKTTGSF